MGLNVKPVPGTWVLCIYCRQPCDGGLHDTYGEFMLGGRLSVCVSCHEDLLTEPGPWSGWS